MKAVKKWLKNQPVSTHYLLPWQINKKTVKKILREAERERESWNEWKCGQCAPSLFWMFIYGVLVCSVSFHSLVDNIKICCKLITFGRSVIELIQVFSSLYSLKMTIKVEKKQPQREREGENEMKESKKQN